MDQIKSVKDIVSFWPSIDDFACAVSTASDAVPTSRVFQWMKANKFPSKYNNRFLAAAERRGVLIKMCDLTRISKQPEGK